MRSLQRLGVVTLRLTAVQLSRKGRACQYGQGAAEHQSSDQSFHNFHHFSSVFTQTIVDTDSGCFRLFLHSARSGTRHIDCCAMFLRVPIRARAAPVGDLVAHYFYKLRDRACQATRLMTSHARVIFGNLGVARSVAISCKRLGMRSLQRLGVVTLRLTAVQLSRKGRACQYGQGAAEYESSDQILQSFLLFSIGVLGNNSQPQAAYHAFRPPQRVSRLGGRADAR